MAHDDNDQRVSRADAGYFLRIMIVEDEFLLGVMLKEDLLAAGHQVLGPFTTLLSAIHATRREEFQLAVLDINLQGEMVYPLADELSSRGIPFIFLTGYGLNDIPEKFRTAPRLAKPYNPPALVREVNRFMPS